MGARCDERDLAFPRFSSKLSFPPPQMSVPQDLPKQCIETLSPPPPAHSELDKLDVASKKSDVAICTLSMIPQAKAGTEAQHSPLHNAERVGHIIMMGSCLWQVQCDSEATDSLKLRIATQRLLFESHSVHCAAEVAIKNTARGSQQIAPRMSGQRCSAHLCSPISRFRRKNGRDVIGVSAMKSFPVAHSTAGASLTSTLGCARCSDSP